MKNEPNASEAAEQLRTIRSLMERATVYRAISAPAALVAGVLSVGLSWWQEWQMGWGGELGSERFTGEWLVVLVVVSLLNVGMLWRSACGRGEPFVSAGMKLALGALVPPLVAGFVLGMLAAEAAPRDPVQVSSCWILFYGLALRATGSFAPRSIQRLGLAFFVAGLLSFLPSVRQLAGPAVAPLFFMALTFGLFHLVYAAAVFLSNRRA
jgi:hypothetical protein